MQVELPQELEPFIEQEFATGRYASRDEVVVQALRWLREERAGTPYRATANVIAMDSSNPERVT